LNSIKFPESVSVVIPACNEAHRIIASLNMLQDFLAQTFVQHEIICVDDGSTDGTRELLDDFAQNHPVRLIRFETNRGKGRAIQCGMLAAAGRYRFFTDADMPYRLDAFSLAMRQFKTSRCDIVAGDRYLPESGQSVPSGRFRKPVGRVFSTLAHCLTDMDIQDSQCGFKGFSEAAAQKIFTGIHTRGYAFDVEIFVLARKMGLSVCRIPVHLVRHSGSGIRMTRDPFRMILELFQIALRYRTFRNPSPSAASDETR